MEINKKESSSVNILSKAAIFTACLSSANAFSSTYVELSDETNDALYHLSSYCVDALVKVKEKSSGSWIGTGAKWMNENNNYGYNFDVFYTAGFFSTEKLGTIYLSANYIPNPPADASNYRYSCNVHWEQ